MKLLNRGLALAVVGAGLAAFPTIGAQAAPAAQADDNGVAAMADQASGEVAVTREGGDQQGRLHPRQGQRRPAPVRRGRLARRGAGQGRRLPRPVRRQLRRPSRRAPTSRRGRQSERRLDRHLHPELPGCRRLRLHAAGAGRRAGRPDLGQRLRRPRPSLSVDPRVSGAEAGDQRGRPRHRGPAADDGDDGADQHRRHRAERPAPGRLPQGLDQGRGRRGRARLVRRGRQRRHGPRRRLPRRAPPASRSTATRWCTTRSSRELYEANGSSNPATFTQVWQEGDPFPGTLNQDQQNEVNSTGESYWFFKNVFGRDSYDGAGHTMTHRQQRRRDQLPQRQLERHDHQLLQRRHLRRRRRPRVGPRLHRVHLTA